MENKRPRIALCLPNQAWQAADSSFNWHMVPYGLALIAAAVRDICDVDIIDANKENLSTGDFSERLAQGAYDLVGISVLMDLFSASGHLAAKLAREVLPEAKVVMGGVPIYPALVMENPAVDFVSIGEGEESIRALVEYLFYNAPQPQTGFAFRHGPEVVIQPRAPFIENLDALPLPAYDLINFASYSHWAPRKAVDGPAAFPYAFICTSRGCPQNCCFCQVAHISGRKFRGRSAEKILEEIAWYKNQYGVRSLIFTDDNLIADRGRAVKLFQGMIDQGLTMPWRAAAMAAFKLDDELLELMAQSGGNFMSIAIESGSPRVLKEIIKKPLKLDHAKRMAAKARSLGIFVSANFVFGFPGETWDEIRQTIRFAEEINVDYVKLFSAVPLRHTALWDMCEKSGAFVPGFDPTQVSWNQGQLRSPHFDERETTMLRAYEWDRINFSSPEKCQRIADMMGISLEELETTRRDTRRLALDRISTTH